MKIELIAHLTKTLQNIGISTVSIALEYPENPDHGDYSTNVAMVHAKMLKMSPKALAEKIIEEFKKGIPDFVESVSVAGPGFINFKIKDSVWAKKILEERKNSESRLTINEEGSKRKVMVEYTDPNPFKIFHIGHLMSNAIGESIARLTEYSGAEVVRACYQGDVGLHVAKTVWAIQNNLTHDGDKLREIVDVVGKVKWLGEMYVEGSKYDDDEIIKKQIADLNKKIFEHTDPKIDKIYYEGRKLSLEYFDLIYKRLDTSFNVFFFESEVADDGLVIVKKYSTKGLFRKQVFTKSDGAIVFKGEDHGLHTRVFITSQGLPTYETKELGLNTKKFKLYPDLDQSVIITANEQSDYFKVVLKAFSLINSKIYSKTKHMSHGMLRFADGKMSSRKGNIIPAETLIDDIKKLVIERIADRGFSTQESDEVSDMIAIAAIKYTILRQAVGTDVIFDSAKSISFEGDSGPYLQYSVVRAKAVIEKAKKEGVENNQVTITNNQIKTPDQVGLLEKLIMRFPDIAERASIEFAPQLVANYLINLSGAFNSFYANNTIVDAYEPLSPYRIILTKKFIETMESGLHILGIKVPNRM
jgi:arginyl-tRNA synthetase